MAANTLEVGLSRAYRNQPDAPLHLLAPYRPGRYGHLTLCRDAQAVGFARPLEQIKNPRCGACTRLLRRQVEAGDRPAEDLDRWLA